MTRSDWISVVAAIFAATNLALYATQRHIDSIARQEANFSAQGGMNDMAADLIRKCKRKVHVIQVYRSGGIEPSIVQAICITPDTI